MNPAQPPEIRDAPALIEREPSPPSPARRAPVRLALQIVLFLVCLALFVWCIARVFSPSNRTNLERLLSAPLSSIAALLGLSALVVASSGAAFRQALTPVRRLPMGEVQAVNAIASLLALLPFKLSVLFRVLVHNRRDGLPLLTIGAWFGSVGAVMAAVLGPVILASLWRPRVDAAWALAASLGIAASLAAIIITARCFRPEPAWQRVERLWRKAPMPGVVCRSGLIDRAHEGVRLLASPAAVLSSAALRIADLALQSARFIVAGAIVGQPFASDQALLAGSTYFLIGALAPTGQLGAREAGTSTILNRLAPALDLDRVMTAVLAISAADILVLLTASLIATLILRPDRLLRKGTGKREQGTEHRK